MYVCGGRARPSGAGGSMKYQFRSFFLTAGWAKENIPGGGPKFQFVYVHIVFKKINPYIVTVYIYILFHCTSDGALNIRNDLVLSSLSLAV